MIHQDGIGDYGYFLSFTALSSDGSKIFSLLVVVSLVDTMLIPRVFLSGLWISVFDSVYF